MAFLVPFIPEHLGQMEAKDGTATEVAGSPGVADALVRLGANTMFANNGKTVLGVIGVSPVIPGVCEVFVLASKQQMGYPVSFARTIRKELGFLRSKYRRIQAVTSDDIFHKRWITWLGFKCEGTLKKYGLHGENMIMWSLV